MLLIPNPRIFHIIISLSGWGSVGVFEVDTFFARDTCFGERVRNFSGESYFLGKKYSSVWPFFWGGAEAVMVAEFSSYWYRKLNLFPFLLLNSVLRNIAYPAKKSRYLDIFNQKHRFFCCEPHAQWHLHICYGPIVKLPNSWIGQKRQTNLPISCIGQRKWHPFHGLGKSQIFIHKNLWDRV